MKLRENIIKKDFDVWNIQKKEIHNHGRNRLYRLRDIWWCNLGLNIGYEQDGTGENNGRPVLVLKGLSRNICLVIPLTTSIEQHFMRIPIGEIDGKNASGIISQIRVIDTKRFVNKIGKIDKKRFDIIRKAIKNLI
ncbi:MAG: type II toxin-antitoxin system PemK/MazF family toxin [Patescibacteria group bacterium]